MLKKFWLIFRYKKIKDNKKAKVLPKVMQRIYDENSEMPEVINVVMIEVYNEESLYPEQVFSLFCFVFIIMAILEKNLNKYVEDIKNSLWRFWDYVKRRKFLLVTMLVFSFMSLI